MYLKLFKSNPFYLFSAESAEALLSFKNGGFKVKRELDFGDDDSDQGNQAMTLGPEMFGLKRITDVNTKPSPAVKGNGNPVTPIALNRRGVVSSSTINNFNLLF